MNSRLRFVIQWGVIAVFVVFASRYLLTQWQQLDLTETPIDGATLLAAQVLYCLGMAMIPLGSWFMQRWYGYDLPAITLWRTFYLAQLSKYLPGGIWSIVGRVVLYRQHGVSSMDSAALMMLEIIGLVIGASAVGVLSLPVFLPLLMATEIPLFVLFAAGGLAGIAVLYATRSRWMPAFQGVRILPFVGTCLLYAANWIVLGLAFCMIAAAFSLPLGGEDVIVIVGVHAVAWLIGFLIVFAPGGIGVRDVILAVGLAAFVAEPYPLIISLLARIAWTIAELTDFVLVTTLQQAQKRLRS